VLEDGGATITGYVGEPPVDLVIPGQLGGYPVVSIAEEAFIRRHEIIGVTLPGSLVVIGDFAFENCASLSSIHMPDGIIDIGRNAFSLCRALTSVKIPDTVVRIGDDAFTSAGLSSINIPAGVTNIGDNPFAWCKELSAIEVDPGNPVYVSVEGVLFDRHQNMLVSFPCGQSSQTYAVPQGTLVIGNRAFWGCYVLAEIIIPEGVTSIGSNAFLSCRGLTSVRIPGSVVSIDQNFAYYGQKFALNNYPNLILTVVEGSFAEEYAQEYEIPYVFMAE